MTEQEIDEAKKLIADMRDDLTVLGGSTDAEKPAALLVKKLSCMLGSLTQLHRLLKPRALKSWLFDSMHNRLLVMCAFAEVAQRKPAYKEKLAETMLNKMPAVISVLDKIEQYLATKNA